MKDSVKWYTNRSFTPGPLLSDVNLLKGCIQLRWAPESAHTLNTHTNPPNTRAQAPSLQAGDHHPTPLTSHQDHLQDYTLILPPIASPLVLLPTHLTPVPSSPLTHHMPPGHSSPTHLPTPGKKTTQATNFLKWLRSGIKSITLAKKPTDATTTTSVTCIQNSAPDLGLGFNPNPIPNLSPSPVQNPIPTRHPKACPHHTYPRAPVKALEIYRRYIEASIINPPPTTVHRPMTPSSRRLPEPRRRLMYDV